jgi:plastocyanin
MKARLTPLVGGLLLAAVTLAGCGSSGSGYNGNPMSPSPTPTPTPTPAPVGASVTIRIVGMSGAQSFSPNPSSVTAGQTVSFYNADSIVHRIAANDGSWNTGNLNPGATSTPITMATAAVVGYHCVIHPDMVGTLTVLSAAGVGGS